MQLTVWQRFRTRTFLFAVGVSRRMVVGARAVLIDGNKVLLVKPTYLPGWHFPGGGVEPGETAENAAAREVLEETGYEAAGRPALHGLFLNRSVASDRDHVALYIWRNFANRRAFVPNFEIADCRWVERGNLPPDTEPGTAARVAEIFGGTTAPAEWLP